jgi:sec-independent protein translocase protein TatB
VFNLGAGEITVILVLALIFLGPKKLPDLATGLGKLIREIRKATSDVKNEITLDDSFRKPFEELRDAVTLHPDELKRRDQIRRSVEEAKKRAEQAEAERVAAAAAAAPLLPELPAQEPGQEPGNEAAAVAETPAQAPASAQVPANLPPVVPSIVPPVVPPTGTVPRARPAPAAVPAQVLAHVESVPMSVPSAEESAPFSSPARPTPSSEILTSAVTPLGGAPRVTPPVSSLDGGRANATQTLSEADLLASVPQPSRKPTPPPLPGLDRQPPPANRMGLPRVTPPVSSLSGDRANATQSLSESDLLPPGAGKPPPLPGPKKA